MISMRFATRGRGRWADSVELFLNEAGVPSSTADRFLISRGEADLSDLRSPVLVHETLLDPRPELPTLAANDEATVVLIPSETLSGSVVVDSLLPEDQFWKLLGSGPSALMMTTARRNLRTQSRATVLAFQGRLVERASALVGARGASWDVAGSSVLIGRMWFDRRLAGEASLPPDAGTEFADLTDIAEDILGTRIEVPGYGDSRSGLGATPAPRTRWLSWRAIAERDGQALEVFFFGERPGGTSMREMLPRVREAMSRDGLAPRSEIETWFPDMIHHVPALFLVPYEIRRKGPTDFAEYARENAFARPLI